MNRDVLGFSLVASLVSGILFGLAPALHASRGNLNESLKEGERGSTSGHGRTRSVLVVAEVGLSLILLVGSGLLVKSFVRLMKVDPGFDTGRLLVFNVGLPPTTAPPQQDDFYRQVVERLRALPGVQSAGAVSRLPLAGGNSDRSFQLPGSKTDYNADIRVSTPSYFQTMGIPLLRGRTLAEQDVAGQVQVAVINQALAETVFPGQDPIGKYMLNFGPGNDKLQIVGVVGNVRHVGLETAPRPEVYLAFGQARWPSAFVVVRSKISDPLALASAAPQNVVGSVNRDIPLANVRNDADVIAESVLAAVLPCCCRRYSPGSPCSRCHWTLRSDVLHGFAAHTRNRNSHGFGRAERGCVETGGGAGNEAGWVGGRLGTGCLYRSDSVDG